MLLSVEKINYFRYLREDTLVFGSDRVNLNDWLNLFFKEFAMVFIIGFRLTSVKYKKITLFIFERIFLKDLQNRFTKKIENEFTNYLQGILTKKKKQSIVYLKFLDIYLF